MGHNKKFCLENKLKQKAALFIAYLHIVRCGVSNNSGHGSDDET
jgi:hypothetical protein